MARLRSDHSSQFGTPLGEEVVEEKLVADSPACNATDAIRR